ARDGALADLVERDRRLAYELAAGVLRRRGQLDRMLELATANPRLHDVLRLGAYQLRALARVPAYAAVSTSGELAREVAGEKAAPSCRIPPTRSCVVTRRSRPGRWSTTPAPLPGASPLRSSEVGRGCWPATDGVSGSADWWRRRGAPEWRFRSRSPIFWRRRSGPRRSQPCSWTPPAPPPARWPGTRTPAGG